MNYHLDVYTPQDITADQLSADLLRDFYQTFRLAQSETAVQPPLFTRLSRQHQILGSAALLPVALQLADGAVDKMMPPAHHTVTGTEDRNNPHTGFRAMWTEYSDVLMNPDHGINRPIEYVLDDILHKDIYYQKQPRPHRSGNTDPHASIAREYILGNDLTGSRPLMEVRDQLRESLLDPSDDCGSITPYQLEELTQKWEANHPGQSFMPKQTQPIAG